MKFFSFLLLRCLHCYICARPLHSSLWVHSIPARPIFRDKRKKRKTKARIWNFEWPSMRRAWQRYIFIYTFPGYGIWEYPRDEEKWNKHHIQQSVEKTKKTKVENGVRKVCVYGDLLDFPFIYLRDTSHNFVVVYKYISRAFRCLS